MAARKNSAARRHSKKSAITPPAGASSRDEFDRRLAEFYRVRWNLTEEQYLAITEFATTASEKRLTLSRQIVAEAIIDARSAPDIRLGPAIAESESLLTGYSTLDEPHRVEVRRLIREITEYVQDATRQRPLNALMLAMPGAGKSHFIKKLAEAMSKERVRAVTFNMATMHAAEDMSQPIDELRNVKVNDEFPLLFLDEFDSNSERYPMLLPLLWDGELHVGHRKLRLGKAVIVLAGSNPELPKTMSESATMGLETNGGHEAAVKGKLLDLLSRINGGVIEIPDLDLQTERRDRRVDKVCITVGLLRSRYSPELRLIPRALLRFIAHTTFRYNVRSIAHLVDLISATAYSEGTLMLEKLGLPFQNEAMLQESSVRLHVLDRNGAFGIVKRWSDFAKDEVVVDVANQIPLNQFAWR